MAPFLRYVLITLLLLIALPVCACFGPKLYVGTAAGVDGELLFHLVTLYVQEKTGVESIRFELDAEQTAEQLLQHEKVDLIISSTPSDKWSSLLSVADELFLLSGPRPTDDLQFTTVPKALKRLQTRLKLEDLQQLRQQVADGVLPATAVRSFYMQRGWI